MAYQPNEQRVLWPEQCKVGKIKVLVLGLRSLLESCVLFVWLINRIFLANEQYFSLTTNQPTVLSTMAYQPNEQGNSNHCPIFVCTSKTTRLYITVDNVKWEEVYISLLTIINWKSYWWMNRAILSLCV